MHLLSPYQDGTLEKAVSKDYGIRKGAKVMNQTDVVIEQNESGTVLSASQIFEEKARKTISGIVALYIIVILGVFPLYFQNYYFDILVAKYKFYWISTVVMLALCLIAATVFAVMDMGQFGGEHVKGFFTAFKPSQLKKQPLAYKAVVIFWIFALLSTILSDYVYESFWGNEGRYSGLFLITLYVVGTIVIGKYGRMRKWYLDVFLLSSVLVCLFGITDYFQMDFLGWKRGINDYQSKIFVSTLGNINTYTAFVALTMAISCGLFASEKNIVRRLWYYLCAALAFFSLITGQSDNAYLSLGILFAVMPLFLFTTWHGIADYSILVATFVTVIKIVDTVNKVYADQVIGLSGLFEFLVKYKYLEILVAIFWILALALYMLSKKMEKNSTEADTRTRSLHMIWRGWCIVLILAFLLLLFILADANLLGHADRYSELSSYLVFNDSWGTDRGYCWRIGWQSYRAQSFIHQLFGFGADTFGILTWDYRQEALDTYGVFYENAHNEYLQYLVTIGPFALISYLVFLISSCTRICRKWKECTWIMAPVMAVLCYAAQAFVNINLPIATPIMWAMLAMGLSMTRDAKTSE